MKRNSHKFPVEKMCKLLRVGRNGYENWLLGKQGKRAQRRSFLLFNIKKVYTWSKGRYGAPRITDELKAQGINASRPLVSKLMKKAGLKSKVRKKYKVTTDSSHNYPISPNLLKQHFLTTKANQVWVSDITYVRTSQGWLYLTVIIDLYDRKIVGWSTSSRLSTRSTIIPAWNMAILNRPIREELTFHSDRGVQYASTLFRNYLKVAKKVKQSMSRKGNCWDNAVAESFFKSIKTELTYHEHYKTRQQAALSIFEYIEVFYNKCRRHSALNNRTIDEFNQLYNQTAA